MISPTRMTRSNGFTLIEILIVIVIISIVSGVALVTISNNSHKQLESLANQLTRLITLAEQEAMLQPATLGLGFDNQHFQFFNYRKDTWQAINNKNLPKDVSITLKVNNQRMALDGKPHIFISQSGDITPFIIMIGEQGSKPAYIVKGDVSGKVETEVFHEK